MTTSNNNEEVIWNLAQFEMDLIKEVKNSERLGLDCAKKESLYEQIEDFKKPVLADNTPNEGTEGHKEREAYKSEAYKNHLYGLSAAREDAKAARVKYHASLARVDVLRTIMSNHREMTKRGI